MNLYEQTQKSGRKTYVGQQHSRKGCSSHSAAPVVPVMPVALLFFCCYCFKVRSHSLFLLIQSQ